MAAPRLRYPGHWSIEPTVDVFPCLRMTQRMERSVRTGGDSKERAHRTQGIAALRVPWSAAVSQRSARSWNGPAVSIDYSKMFASTSIDGCLTLQEIERIGNVRDIDGQPEARGFVRATQ